MRFQGGEEMAAESEELSVSSEDEWPEEPPELVPQPQSPKIKCIFLVPCTLWPVHINFLLDDTRVKLGSAFSTVHVQTIEEK